MDSSPNFRQGDVNLFKIDKIPATAKKRKDKVLAYGEATGHEHRIIDGDVFDDKDGNLYVRAVEGTDLTQTKHGVVVEDDPDIHGTAPLDPGDYEVVIQEQYEPDGWRRVAD